MKIFLLALSLLFTIVAFGQYTSTQDGAWTDGSTWGGVAPGTNFAYDVYVYNNVTHAGGIGVLFFGYLEIGNNDGTNDTLEINDLTLFLGGDMRINQDGVVVINGDLNSYLISDIDIDGSLEVNGDVYNDGSSVINVNIGGDFIVDGYIDNDGTINNNGYVSADSIIGEGDYSGNPLPIELLYFEAVNQNGVIKLTWATASEKNNDRFEIYHGVDGVYWEVMTTVPGHGNSNTPLEYVAYDHMLGSDLKYYFLRQIDYDGRYEDFRIISVMGDVEDIENILIYNINGIFVRSVDSWEEIYHVDERVGIVVVRTKYGIFCKKFLK